MRIFNINHHFRREEALGRGDRKQQGGGGEPQGRRRRRQGSKMIREKRGKRKGEKG